MGSVAYPHIHKAEEYTIVTEGVGIVLRQRPYTRSNVSAYWGLLSAEPPVPQEGQ